VTDGIVWQLPALILYTKLLRKAALVDLRGDGERSRTRAIDAVHSLSLAHVGRRRAVQLGRGEHVGRRHRGARGDAQWAGVDLEGVLRERARQLRDEIRIVEATS